MTGREPLLYRSLKVTRTDAKPRLVGQQPHRHGGVLREMTWLVPRDRQADDRPPKDCT
jgi:hypothetical protein